MALLSLDPQFDFTTYGKQVCYFVYPYLKLHINLFWSGRKQKKAKHCYALVRVYTQLSDLRVQFEEYRVKMFFLEKNFQNSKLLTCEIGKMTLFQELFHFSTTQGNMLANATYPTYVKNCVRITCMYRCISWDVMLMITFISKLCSRKSKGLSVGVLVGGPEF